LIHISSVFAFFGESGQGKHVFHFASAMRESI
jgi:hypothetical protein